MNPPSYYQLHRDELLAYQKKYRQDHKQYFLDYYQKNKTYFRAQAKAWQKNNPQKYKDALKKWRGKNLEKTKKHADLASRKPLSRFKAGRKSADQRRLEWAITFEQYLELIKHLCHYCGGNLPTKGCGLDRKDSDLGYLPTNVVPCCKGCNLIKGCWYSYEQMLTVVAALKTANQWPPVQNHL